MKSIKIATSKTNRKKQIISKVEKKFKLAKSLGMLVREPINPATRGKIKVSLRELMKLRGEENE